MRKTLNSALDCIKQLLPNLAATGIWEASTGAMAGASVSAAATGGTSIPLYLTAGCVLGYIGLKRKATTKEEFQQEDLRAAIEIIRERSESTEAQLEQLGFQISHTAADVYRRLITLEGLIAQRNADETRILDYLTQNHELLNHFESFIEEHYVELREFRDVITALPSSIEELNASVKAIQDKLFCPTQTIGRADIVGQNVNVSIENRSAADAETLKKIVNRYESILKRSDSELQRSESENEELRAQLADALKRAESVANAGDQSAKKAIEQARQTGDVEDLQSVLIREADKLGDAVKEQMAEYVELCREIAATAYARGDIVETEKRLRIIIRALPNDRHALNQLGRVFALRGELAKAEKLYRRVLRLSSGDLVGSATALGNLGIIEKIRGNLDAAEKLHRESLEFYRKLGHIKGQASQLGNLGLIEQIRGNLDASEKLHRESLEIERELGHLEGQANQLGSLGLIEHMRGNLDAAEILHRESLEINRRLGHLEGQAKQLGNIGLIERTRGNLDAAEILLRESLEIDRNLGHLEGQANQLGNLGLIEQTRGNLDTAGKLHRESLEIDRMLGHLEGQACTLGNLGLIELDRGNLDAAEKLYRGALDINRNLGRIHGQAIQLTNLGIIEQLRGNLAEAKEVWTQALVLFENTGMKLEAENIRRLLDNLPPE